MAQPMTPKSAPAAASAKKGNPWNIISAILAIALIAILVVNSSKSDDNGMVALSAQEVETEILNFVDKIYGPQIGVVTPKETTEESGLYKITVGVVDPTTNQPVDQIIYATKDAKLFGGKNELGDLVNTLRRLAEERDKELEEQAEIDRERVEMKG